MYLSVLLDWVVKEEAQKHPGYHLPGVTWIGLHVLFLQAESEIVTFKWCVHAFTFWTVLEEYALMEVEAALLKYITCSCFGLSLEGICFTNNNLELLEKCCGIWRLARLKRAKSDHLFFYFDKTSNALLLQPHWDLLQGDLCSILDIQIEVKKLTFFFFLSWDSTSVCVCGTAESQITFVYTQKRTFFCIDHCRK